MGKEFLTVSEMARLKECHVMTIYRAIYAKKLAAEWHYNRWLIPYEVAEAWERSSRGRPPAPQNNSAN